MVFQQKHIGRVEDKMTENTIEKKPMEFKIFDLYDVSEIKIEDPGLRNVINTQPKLLVKSQGRNVVKHGQTKVNIVERLMNRLAVAGHRGKKHKIILGSSTGKYARYPQAVDVAPIRRVNLAIKHIIHGASDKAFGKKKTITQALAEEIVLAYENNGDSFAIRKRNESEKQADSAR